MRRKEPLGFTHTHVPKQYNCFPVLEPDKARSIRSVYVFLPDLFTQHCEIHP